MSSFGMVGSHPSGGGRPQRPGVAFSVVETDDAANHPLSRPTGFDVVVSGVTFLASASTAAFTATKDGEPPFRAVSLGLILLGAIPLLWRRRFPVTALFGAGLSAAVYGVFDWPDPLLPFGVFVALVSVFEFSTQATKWASWAAAALLGSVGTALVADSDALDWWAVAFLLIAAPLVGDYLRSRRRLIEETSARMSRLEAERLVAIEDARAAERARVARELHDVVAHHVTMLVVQAEAAASRATVEGSDVQSAFDDLARCGRAAMDELRHLLGVLREEGATPLVGPQPSVCSLDALVTDVRSAGVETTVLVEGPLTGLPAAVDLTAHRIVQEALTNVVKHAPGASATVSILRGGDELKITVTNSAGRASPNGSSQTSAGVGLIGLQERVDLLNGTLTAGLRPLGGFHLEAHLPIEVR